MAPTNSQLAVAKLQLPQMSATPDHPMVQAARLSIGLMSPEVSPEAVLQQLGYYAPNTSMFEIPTRPTPSMPPVVYSGGCRVIRAPYQSLQIMNEGDATALLRTLDDATVLENIALELEASGPSNAPLVFAPAAPRTVGGYIYYFSPDGLGQMPELTVNFTGRTAFGVFNETLRLSCFDRNQRGYVVLLPFAKVNALQIATWSPFVIDAPVASNLTITTTGGTAAQFHGARALTTMDVESVFVKAFARRALAHSGTLFAPR